VDHRVHHSLTPLTIHRPHTPKRCQPLVCASSPLARNICICERYLSIGRGETAKFVTRRAKDLAVTKQRLLESKIRLFQTTDQAPPAPLNSQRITKSNSFYVWLGLLDNKSPCFTPTQEMVLSTQEHRAPSC